jgi:hypothetical protein
VLALFSLDIVCLNWTPGPSVGTVQFRYCVSKLDSRAKWLALFSLDIVFLNWTPGLSG